MSVYLGPACLVKVQDKDKNTQQGIEVLIFVYNVIIIKVFIDEGPAADLDGSSPPGKEGCKTPHERLKR